MLIRHKTQITNQPIKSHVTAYSSFDFHASLDFALVTMTLDQSPVIIPLQGSNTFTI